MNWLSGTFDLFRSFLASLWSIETRSSCFWGLKCTLDKWATENEVRSYRWLRSPTLLKSSWQSGHTNCPRIWKRLRWRELLRRPTFSGDIFSSAPSISTSIGSLGSWLWLSLSDMDGWTSRASWSRTIVLLSWDVDAADWVLPFDASTTLRPDVRSFMAWLRACSSVSSGVRERNFKERCGARPPIAQVRKSLWFGVDSWRLLLNGGQKQGIWNWKLAVAGPNWMAHLSKVRESDTCTVIVTKFIFTRDTKLSWTAHTRDFIHGWEKGGWVCGQGSNSKSGFYLRTVVQSTSTWWISWKL